MKLKLLIAPLLVLLIVVMAIWVIGPAYQNLQAQKKELAAAQKKLADIQEKNMLAAKLKQALADNPAQKEMLLKYLPEKAQEELIIENLSSLMQGEGLTLVNLAVLDDSRKKSTQAAPVMNDASPGEIAPAALAADSIGISVGFVGPYEKIRSFMGKLATLKRDNNVAALKITAVAAAAGSLQADMVLNLAYFTGGNSAINASSSVFSKDAFDMLTIDQIKNKLSTEIIPVTIGEAGKANPFLP
ncbi:MAG: hypothetical protein WC608_04615 [Parcubacteria group bacterium]